MLLPKFKEQEGVYPPKVQQHRTQKIHFFVWMMAPQPKVVDVKSLNLEKSTYPISLTFYKAKNQKKNNLHHYM